MSDAVTTAKNARESLARGLGALQSDPKVPQSLLELAAPIAQAMSLLHHIEKSQGKEVQPHAENALTHVRTALAQLQAQPTSHPAIMGAMEAVASSLGLVHQLSRMGALPRAPSAPPPAISIPRPAAIAATEMARPQTSSIGPTQPAPAYSPQPAHTAIPVGAIPSGAQGAAAVNAMPNPAPLNAPPADHQAYAAELGAHSSTNFYKGLAGNDIVDHGGLFVSTYKIPRIGTPVRLRVSLPGGYEFEANGVVRWCREQSDAGNDAPPGFGAQFTDITPEARQLVYRYVRNREPLFHDDL